MTEIDPAVVARIKKLMNLSQDGAASENEQEIAAAHAQRLMMEHNITIAQVEAAGNRASNKRKKDKVVGFAMYEWQKDLMSSVATTNFVKVISTVGKREGEDRQIKSYDLIGREENVIGARILFDYLRTTIERLARDYAGGNAMAMSNEAMSFKKGCSARVCQRLLARHREALAEQKAAAEAQRATGSNALVVFMTDYAEAEECANEDFRMGYELGTTARNRYVGARMSAAFQAVLKALREDPTLAKCTDRATLEQKAQEVLAEVTAADGLNEQELARCKNYAGHAVDHHHVDGLRPGRKPQKERSYRPRKGPIDRTNYHAFNAGRAAGDSVSLNRQAAHSPMKGIK